MAGPTNPSSRFAAVLAPRGQELLAIRRRQERHPAQALRLGTELRAAYPVDLVVAALAQHELRLRAQAKFSRAMDMFFTRAGLEQASAEVIARHRMARYEGAGLVADLCCGIGGGAGPRGWKLESIAVGRDRKEAVAWPPARAPAATRAPVLPGGHTLPPGRGGPVPVRPPGGFLLAPSPAVTRAGVVEDLARLLGAWKIDERIAFLSAGTALRTPFARTLQVIDSAPWNQRNLPTRLRALDVGAVDIRRRGLAGDVTELHRRLRLSGPRRATLAR